MMALLAMAAAAFAAALLWPLPAHRRLPSPATEMPHHPRRSWRSSRANAARGETAVSAGDVPLVLDLLAMCLVAGTSPAAGLAAVGRAVPGPLGERLATVARGLGLGATARQAWAPVLDGRSPALQRAAERFVHAERSGAALAPALSALAGEQRRSLQLSRARAARRVGVLAAAPLGLCFLPAFILTGVLPIVAGLVTGLALG